LLYWLDRQATYHYTRVMEKENKRTLEWYEYDKAEEQVEALQSKIDEATKDLKRFDLSAFSRNAILNEIERYSMYLSDVLEQMENES